MHKTILTIIAAIAVTCPARAQEIAPLFPFQPAHDTPGNITNVRTWDGVSDAPAGANGFVVADGDHFVDGNGAEMRFIGTNLGMTGCFPSHEDADKLAKELTRYGINIVRMHYVSHRTPKNGYPVLNSFIEPVQLELFDYLFAKLKEQGIYVYFQLNIARKASGVNGLVNPGNLPYYKNGLDNFEYILINLQKRFHKEILTHVNPYTGIAYKDDPAITMFELANENSIVNSWYSPKHKFTALVEPYRGRLLEMWNRFLTDKYGTTAELKEAWGASDTKSGRTKAASSGQKVLETSSAPSGIWQLQETKRTMAGLQTVKATKKDNLESREYARLTVEKTDEGKAQPKLYCAGISLKRMQAYTVRFKARSDTPLKLTLRVGQRLSPYKAAGLQTAVNLGSRWQEYDFNFISLLDDNDIKITFSDFKDGCTADFADLTITEGINYVWPEGQSLENANVDWPYMYNRYIPWQRAKDWTEFIAEVESTYFRDLYFNVKNNIGVRQSVAGTQLCYGFNQPQAEMDYCDIHDYWCHPSFPEGKWSWTYWQLRNDAIVNSAGSYKDNGCPGATFVQMARARILGKPFTVSEYDQPNLNYYCAEGDLMLSAMAAFQNWSALMQFAWILDRDYNREYVNGMFDMCSAPQKLVHFPACWAMFVRGDVRKGNGQTTFAMPSSYERDIEAVALGQEAKAHREVESPLLKSLPLAVVSGRQLSERPDLFSGEGRTVIEDESDVPEGLKEAFDKKVMKSSTGEITWDWSNPKAGVFMVDTRRTKVFSGFIKGRSFTYSGMRLTPGRTRLDWMTLSLTQAHADGESRNRSLLAPGSYLLAATGVVRNTGQKIVNVPGPGGRISCSREDGGDPGTSPVLCEGVEAELAFAGLRGRVQCFALDPEGERTVEVPVTESPAGEAIIHIGPEYRTVWYEVIVKPRNN